MECILKNTEHYMKLYTNTKKICLFKSVECLSAVKKKKGKRESTCLSVWIKNN